MSLSVLHNRINNRLKRLERIDQIETITPAVTEELENLYLQSEAMLLDSEDHLSEREEELKLLQDKLLDMEKQKNDKEKSLLLAVKHNQEIEARLHSIRNLYTDLQKELSESRLSLTKLNRLVLIEQETKERYEKELLSEKTERKNLEIVINELRGKLKDAETQAAIALNDHHANGGNAATISELESRVAFADAKLAAVVKELSDSKGFAASQRQTIADLRESYASLEDKVCIFM